MRASLRFPILAAIGLGIGLVIGLALAHLLWLAVAMVLAFTAVRIVLQRRSR